MDDVIHIESSVIQEACEGHLLGLLESTFDTAVRAEVRTYYPASSILALVPTEADLERARAAVTAQARETDFANLVPRDCGLRPCFEEQGALHRAFLKRLVANTSAHAEQIGRELLGRQIPTRILSLSVDGADSHNGSKQTTVITTDAGSFVYKPRSLKPDICIKALCEELFGDMFLVPAAIDCGSFGFSQFIASRDPATPEELQGYFTRLGAFCALAHFLALSDLHAENFLAQGAQVVPIDLETTLATAFRWGMGTSQLPRDCFSADVHTSIARTGMLTISKGNLFGAILAGTAHTISPLSTQREAYEHRQQIVAGFKSAYRTCLEHKERIAQALHQLQDAPQRVLLETTQYYHLLRKRFFNAQTWGEEDGFRMMDKALCSPARGSFPPEVTAAEAADIARGDIPFFSFLPQSTSLLNAEGTVLESFVSDTPLSLALRHLEALDEDDLRFQSQLLMKVCEDMPFMREDKPGPLKPAASPLEKAAALNEAAEILERTYEDIVPGKHSLGGLWSTHYGETHRDPADITLGEGYAGAGVFAAACLNAEAGDADHAMRLLDLCLRELDCHAQRYATLPELRARTSLGLADGLGGILRALQLIWRYTHDERVPDIYARLLSMLEDLDFSTVRGSNVYNGLAGTLLVLACDAPGLARSHCIVNMADELLSRSNINESGHHVWTEPDGTCGEVGYGKGAGGIGLAFLRAWQTTGEARYWEACCDALAYEDAAYDEEAGFWPLKAQAKRTVCPPGICRGVSGQSIIFTEAAKLDVPLAQHNVQRAVECMRTLPSEPTDNLCCGTSAIVEGLLALGLEREAGLHLSAQLARKEQLGNYVTENTKRAPYFNPGMFFGCLGVGYELLRYAQPDAIESLFI